MIGSDPTQASPSPVSRRWSPSSATHHPRQRHRRVGHPWLHGRRAVVAALRCQISGLRSEISDHHPSPEQPSHALSRRALGPGSREVLRLLEGLTRVLALGDPTSRQPVEQHLPALLRSEIDLFPLIPKCLVREPGQSGEVHLAQHVAARVDGGWRSTEHAGAHRQSPPKGSHESSVPPLIRPNPGPITCENSISSRRPKWSKSRFSGGPPNTGAAKVNASASAMSGDAIPRFFISSLLSSFILVCLPVALIA